ncbi:MAG: hypothetical protein IPG76_02805 [Acidobacteria bacterium]|nr:hypothetical protein [Acidobacteriota bacterium]
MASEGFNSTYDPQRPVCRTGIEAQPLANGMVYISHPEFSSLIINKESWGFLQLCTGLEIEALNEIIPERLGFRLTIDQLRSSISNFASRGLFVGSTEVSRHYRLFDASWLTARLAPLMRWIKTRWFAAATLLAFVASLVLLSLNWHRFVDEVGNAALAHPIASILLYYLTFIPVALLHEFGHATVVRHHGGEVPEVVIRSNAHFAVLSNTSVLREREAMIWYLSMGTVVDVWVWLVLLIAFHFFSHYLLLMFVLPQTIYFLIYSYSIFNNSDYLKVVASWLGQPVPSRPWNFVRDGWRQRPESDKARKLLNIMTVSLAIKIMITTLLIWTFATGVYRVLVLYAIYKFLVYLIGKWPEFAQRMRR